MPYISMDHRLLTRLGIPCNGSRSLDQILSESVERFEVPWAPQWLAVRGDRSYEFWRAAHEKVFTMEAEETGVPFSEDLPLVCERFELIGRFEED